LSVGSLVIYFGYLNSFCVCLGTWEMYKKFVFKKHNFLLFQWLWENKMRCESESSTHLSTNKLELL